MNKKFIIVILLMLIILLAFVIIRLTPSKKTFPQEAIDTFAKCLTRQKTIMYGAYWCPHCQRQKKLFGTSFKYINYVECTKAVNECKEKNIEGFPTWIYKDSIRNQGEMTFDELAKMTGCKAP